MSKSPTCRLVDLPPPPAGKTGWPWTEESLPVPDRMPDGSEWPRLSIVTPSFNQARFVEETIRSVLLQNYPNVEYIVVDGGSTDGSVEIIRKYAPFLDYFVSAQNQGHADAVNKGMQRATGAILAFINSDDFYLPGSFAAIVRQFQGGEPADLIYGGCLLIEQNGREFIQHFGNITSLDEILDFANVWCGNREFIQPETFWRRSIFEKTGAFKPEIHALFFYEYLCRMLMAGAVFRRFDQAVACFRFHPAQRSQVEKDNPHEEFLTMIEPWLGDMSLPIPALRRRELQIEWYHNRKYRPLIADSIKRRESRVIRLARTASLCLRHPQVLPALPVVQRLKSEITSRLHAKGEKESAWMGNSK